MDDRITVTCSDHRDLLVSGLWSSFTTNYLADFSVDWNGRMVRAHQLILDIFLPPDKLELSEVADRRGNLDLLLEFIYTGKVEVQRDQVEDMICVAKKLDFKLMVDALEVATTESEPREANPRECGRGRRKRVHPTKLKASHSTVPKFRDTESCVSDCKKSHIPPTKTKKSVWAPQENDDHTGDLNLEVDEGCSSQGDPESNDPEDPDFPEDPDYPDDPDDTDDPSGDESEDAKVDVSGSCKKKPAKPNAARTSKRSKTSSDLETDKNAARLKEYIRTHPMIKCKQCSFKSRSKKSHQVHLAAEHDSGVPLFRCPTCSRPFLDETSLDHHRQFQHRRRDGAEDCTEFHRCPHCEYKSRYKVYYEVHLSRRHGQSNAEIFRCDCCSLVFLRREAYDRHKESHREYQCAHCPFTTEKKWTYTNHLFSTHRLSEGGTPVEKHQCPQCQYKGKNAAVLRYHIAARHTVEKPYKCSFPECNYASGTKGARDKHFKVAHQDVKNYMCEFCSFRTTSSVSLEIHRRTHTGEKPFQCSECERRFSDSYRLKKHLRLHTNPNDKPFLCHLCSFACNRRDNLRTHLKGVHKNQIGSADRVSRCLGTYHDILSTLAN